VSHLPPIRRPVAPGTINAELRPHASRSDHFRFGSNSAGNSTSALSPLFTITDIIVYGRDR
jgi:hypothetical protein